MRTPKEWAETVHRTVHLEPAAELERQIGLIQADALRHAADICHNIGSIHSNSDMAKEHFIDRDQILLAIPKEANESN